MDERTKKPAVEVPQADKELRAAFARLTKTEDGIKVFRHLMTQFGFKNPCMVMNKATGELIGSSMLWNEAKRDSWLEIRKYIPHKQLNLIEMER